MKKLLGLLLLFSVNSSFSADTVQQNDTKEEASDSDDNNANAIEEATLTFPHVQFSPGLQELLIKLISEEKKAYLGAWFRFTLYKPAQAMVKQMKSRKIVTGIIVDESNIKDDFCAPLKLIAENGGEIRKKTKSRNRQNLGNFEVMHHKFMIFAQNMEDKPLVWTGSFNATGQADLKNCENAVILDDAASIAKFRKEFKVVWDLGTKVEAKNLISAKDRNRSNGFARRMNGIA